MPPVDGLQIYGNIFNPLEPSTQVGPAPTDVEGEEQEMPAEQDAPEDNMLPMADQQPMGGGGMVSPESARYFGPEGRCVNCVHYMDPGSCEIVSGDIEPDGICSLFTQDSMEEEPALPEEPMPEEAPMPELPVEGPEGM